MQPLSGNQRPDLLTALMNMSLVLRLPRKMHLCRSSSHVPRLPTFLEMLQNPHVLLTFDKVHNPLRLPRETTSERPKVLRRWVFFFWLFHFEMFFAPQWRAFFRHLNFQKCSEREFFLLFHLHMFFAPQWRALFSTSQLPKVVRVWGILYILTWKCTSRHIGAHFFDISTSKRAPTAFWCALYIFTWKCASRHNGVLLFISHLTTWLRPRRFSETLRSHKSLEKHSVSRLSYLFAPSSSFFWDFLFFDLLSSEIFSFLIFFLLSSFFFLLLCSALLCSSLLFSSLLFSSLTLPISAFHLSILSEVWLLNFLRWYIIQDI